MHSASRGDEFRPRRAVQSCNYFGAASKMPQCPVCGATVPQRRLTAHVNACLDGRGPASLREDLPPALCMLAGEAALSRLDTRRKLHGSPCSSAPAGNLSGLLFVRFRSLECNIGHRIMISLGFEGQMYRMSWTAGQAAPVAAEAVFSVVEYCASAPLHVQLHSIPAARPPSPGWCCKSAAAVAGNNGTIFSQEGESLPPQAVLLCESRVPLSSALHPAAAAAEARLGLQHRRAIEAARTASRADEDETDALLSAPTLSPFGRSATSLSPRRWWQDADSGSPDSAASPRGRSARRRESPSAASGNEDANENGDGDDGRASEAGSDDGSGSGRSGHGRFGFAVAAGHRGETSSGLSDGSIAPVPRPAPLTAAATPGRAPSSPPLDRGAAQRRLAVALEPLPPGTLPRRATRSLLGTSSLDGSDRAEGSDTASALAAVPTLAAGDDGAREAPPAAVRDARGADEPLTLSEVLTALASEHEGSVHRLSSDSVRTPSAGARTRTGNAASVRIGPIAPGSTWAAATPSAFAAAETERTLTAARLLAWAPLPKHGSAAAELAGARPHTDGSAISASMHATYGTGTDTGGLARPSAAVPTMGFELRFVDGDSGTAAAQQPLNESARQAALGSRTATLHMRIPQQALSQANANYASSGAHAGAPPASGAASRGVFSSLSAALSLLFRRGRPKQPPAGTPALSVPVVSGASTEAAAVAVTAGVTLELLYVPGPDLAPPHAPASLARPGPVGTAQAASDPVRHARAAGTIGAADGADPASSDAARLSFSPGIVLATPATPACAMHRAAAAGAASLLAAGMHATDRLWLLARTPVVRPALVLRNDSCGDRLSDEVAAIHPSGTTSRTAACSAVPQIGKRRAIGHAKLSVAGFRFGGLSVLDVASLSGQRNIVGLLLERGSTLAALSPRVSPGTHWGVLHYAALCPDKRIAALLLAGHCGLMAAAGRSLPSAPALLDALLRLGCDDSVQAHKAHPSLRGVGGWWRGLPFVLQRAHFASRSHAETSRYVAGVRSLLTSWLKEDEEATGGLTGAEPATPAAGSSAASHRRSSSAVRRTAAASALASDDKEPDTDSESVEAGSRASDRKADAAPGTRTAAAAVAVDDAIPHGELAVAEVVAAIQHLGTPVARALATALLATARGAVHLIGDAAEAGGPDAAASPSDSFSSGALRRHFAVHASGQTGPVPSDSALAAGAAVMPLTVFGWRPTSGRSPVVDIPDAGGNTALALACAAGHSAAVKMLLDLQANRGASNAAGDTPLTHSLRAHRPDIALQLLLWPDKPAQSQVLSESSAASAAPAWNGGRTVRMRLQTTTSGSSAIGPGAAASASPGRQDAALASSSLPGVTVLVRSPVTAARPSSLASAWATLLQRHGHRVAGRNPHALEAPVAAPLASRPQASQMSQEHWLAETARRRVSHARPAAVTSLTGETALLLAARALPFSRGAASAAQQRADKEFEARLLDVMCLLVASGAGSSTASRVLSAQSRPASGSAVTLKAGAAYQSESGKLPGLAAAHAALLAGAEAAAPSPAATSASAGQTPAADPFALHEAVLMETEGETPLHAAAKRGSVAGVRILCHLDDLNDLDDDTSGVGTSPTAATVADLATTVPTGISTSHPSTGNGPQASVTQPLAVDVCVMDAAGRTPRDCALIAAAAGVAGAGTAADLLERQERMQIAHGFLRDGMAAVSALGPPVPLQTGSADASGASSSHLALSQPEAAAGAMLPLLLSHGGHSDDHILDNGVRAQLEALAGFAADAEDAEATADYLDTNFLLPSSKGSAQPVLAADASDQGDEE